MTQEPSVVVPVKVAQATVDYLKTRPYVEVADIIHALLRAPKFEPPAQEKTT